MECKSTNELNDILVETVKTATKFSVPMLSVETVLGMMTNLPCNITPSVPGDQVIKNCLEFYEFSSLSLYRGKLGFILL